MFIFRSIKTNFITQSFGENRIPLYKELKMLGHNGIDFLTKDGEKIYWDCDKEGLVLNIHTDNYGGLGVVVISEEKYKHIFWHLKSFACKAGDILDSGDLLGYADNTGRSTGTHLHRAVKQVRKNKYGNYYTINKDNGFKGAIDPMPYYKNIYVKDHIAILKAQIPIFERAIGFVKALISLKIQLNIKLKKK